MTATFRDQEGRHLVIYGNAKMPGRFVVVSVVVNPGSGRTMQVELTISAARSHDFDCGADSG